MMTCVTALLLQNGLQFLLSLQFAIPTGVICFGRVTNFDPDAGGMLPGSSLVSLVLSHSPFKLSLQPSQSTLPTHRLEQFFLFLDVPRLSARLTFSSLVCELNAIPTLITQKFLVQSRDPSLPNCLCEGQILREFLR